MNKQNKASGIKQILRLLFAMTIVLSASGCASRYYQAYDGPRHASDKVAVIFGEHEEFISEETAAAEVALTLATFLAMNPQLIHGSPYKTVSTTIIGINEWEVYSIKDIRYFPGIETRTIEILPGKHLLKVFRIEIVMGQGRVRHIGLIPFVAQAGQEYQLRTLRITEELQPESEVYFWLEDKKKDIEITEKILLEPCPTVTCGKSFKLYPELATLLPPDATYQWPTVEQRPLRINLKDNSKYSLYSLMDTMFYSAGNSKHYPMNIMFYSVDGKIIGYHRPRGNHVEVLPGYHTYTIVFDTPEGKMEGNIRFVAEKGKRYDVRPIQSEEQIYFELHISGKLNEETGIYGEIIELPMHAKPTDKIPFPLYPSWPNWKQ
jgi:hypothetical protein